MATKQQMKGSPAIPYEDFVPKSEWQEEPEANLLLVHLPGFLKEQMRVTYVHSSRTIRITGERPLEEAAAYRWSRFSKAFPVPQNCIVEKIHGSFKNNILTVTMPKQTITRIPKTTTTSTTNTTPKEPGKEKPLKIQETSYKTPTQEKKDHDEKGLPPSVTYSPPKSATAATKIESKESSKVSEDNQKRKQRDEKFTSGVRLVPSEPATTTKTTEPKMAPEDSYSRQVSGIQNGIKNKKKLDLLGSDQSVQSQPAFLGVETDKVSAKTLTKMYVEKKDKGMMDLAKDTVKKIKGMEMSEEKKLMVNMGVAALVIFALGAYVSYTFSSSSSSSSFGRTRE